MAKQSKPASPSPAGTPLSQALHSHICVRGARTHNLKNIDVDIPRNQLVVITGLSGSGKSSLAFDTLYAEGQRRYVESLSTYARQFLQMMDKPDVDTIDGLSPSIAIEQKSSSHNPRSTVGTVTEIYDYLRLLFSRAGTPYCPTHNTALCAQSVGQMVDSVLDLPPGLRLMIAAPIAREQKGTFQKELQTLEAQGFVRFRIDGKVLEAHELTDLKKNEKHNIDVIIDRIKTQAAPKENEGEAWGEYDAMRQRLAESFEVALRYGKQRAIAIEITENKNDQGQEWIFNSIFSCTHCNYSISELEPRSFSFNSPLGACPTCEGLGIQEFFDPQKIVPFPELSLEGGAIKHWDPRNDYAWSVLSSIAQHYQFSLKIPFEKLSESVRQTILFGSGKEEIDFQYLAASTDKKAKYVTKKHPFEGIIPNVERRYHTTDSAVLKEDLAGLKSLKTCGNCQGTRLRQEARFVRVGEGDEMRTIYEINHQSLEANLAYFSTLKLTGSKGAVAEKIIREINLRLQFLNDVGLNYLSLDRSAETLSGGESQRIRLASQIGTGLTGVMYVLDEPSIGLHQRDNERLMHSLLHLRDIGNSVLVVEHDEDMMRVADHIIDMGPGAGFYGGQVQAAGNFDAIKANPQSLTGQYLSGKKSIAVPKQRALWKEDGFGNKLAIHIKGARGNNLKDVSVEIPIGLFTCVTGVSGSGKSTLINDTLYAAAAAGINRANITPAEHNSIEGLAYFDKVIDVDQSPIGRTPRSNPATYTGIFTPIRELMAEMPMSKERGYNAGRFSFNVNGGRCEACHGDGVIKVEMHFLPDVYVPCDVCHGQRYNRETLDVRFKGKNITDILNLTVQEALDHFSSQTAIARKLKTLIDVGLSYIKLGQSATTLSGGEAQRVKLSLELSKRPTGKTLYILDEPTTGLHFADIEMLLKVLHQLRDHGNTVILIEHNLDVIKTADWIVDLGPEGGGKGGQILSSGTPEQLVKVAASHTGRYLKKYL